MSFVFVLSVAQRKACKVSTDAWSKKVHTTSVGLVNQKPDLRLTMLHVKQSIRYVLRIKKNKENYSRSYQISTSEIICRRCFFELLVCQWSRIACRVTIAVSLHMARFFFCFCYIMFISVASSLIWLGFCLNSHNHLLSLYCSKFCFN